MTQQDKVLIECRDLFKIYKTAELEVVALRGLDLAVGQGESLAVVGPSGSGKSTLLNILAGLERPSAGKVRVGDLDLLTATERELMGYRRHGVGFVGQVVGRNLLPYLSAQENIELPMAIAGVPSHGRRVRAQELLEALGLGDKGGRQPHQLSGGEQQRVAIAVALANKPSLLLADEPTGDLDSASAEMVLRALRELDRTFGVTVVLVTHYVGVAPYVDRMVQIRDGRIGTETVVEPTFRRPGDQAQQEYLVVDRAGRLQLPLEVVERLGLAGRTRLEVEEGRVVIRPAEEQ
ncbi:MAG: ATP-binding cassette domain-containing protein [Chloroflexi bacterium]|nr:ATP-binding cassette domain-containing protein [Chloroflexota bacterium]